MGRYNAKVCNKDRVSIFHGETATLEFRVYDPETVLPFQLQGYTPKAFFPKSDGSWLEKAGAATNNHLGQFEVELTAEEVSGLKCSTIPPKGKDPDPVPVELLLESASARVLIQLKSHLLVLPRLAASGGAS
jgi:hypothetical protein